MTAKQTEMRLVKLKERLAKLEDRLFDARVKENEQFNNVSWGAGMRRSHITSATFKTTDRIRSQIEKVTQQIKDYE